MENKFKEIKLIENDVERLIILRKRLNKSQYEFAKDLGVSASYLGQVENYKFPFSHQLRDRINEYLRMEQELDEKNLFGNFSK
ncbi:helix-turn-helix domain-containing protein [Metabacillus herbersteinensis]|uniref:Helix-turn-helix domain-containing protein n=1 Tax=Metabacillus herbersteinensis TaxID=283816 RepID=A0ABV6GJ88_9BACI